MMKYIHLFSFQLLILFLPAGKFTAIADENWESFKVGFKKSGLYLGEEGIQNFSCYIATDSYFKFLAESSDTSGVYPLKVVWMRGNRVYYVLQPYNIAGPGQNNTVYIDRINDIRQEFLTFYKSWQYCYINPPFQDIPDSVQVEYNSDSVVVTYTISEKSEDKNIRKVFGNPAPLIEIKITERHKSLTIRPTYLIWDGKYVCSGWQTHKYLDRKFIGETITCLELDTLGTYPLPVRVSKEIRSAADSVSTDSVVIFLKGYEFDQPIRELPLPDDKNTP